MGWVGVVESPRTNPLWVLSVRGRRALDHSSTGGSEQAGSQVMGDGPYLMWMILRSVIRAIT